ncbi:MAG: phosphatidylserine decarboxylase family protein [Desulfobacteraceae bacterium]|nr:MAG: phosphatidylserine decarboxylase family protein [Desulfobacteraceae bacterium]
MLSTAQKKERIENKLRIAREGLPFIAIALGLTLIFGLLHWFVLFFLFALISIFVIGFFRDPQRQQNVPTDAVLAPADGWIVRIEHLPADQNPLGRPAQKISIFMSVFNVHVNRNAVSGRVTRIQYFPGKFLSAHLDKASAGNERNQLILETPGGQSIVVVQIAGLIARRIVCWVNEGEEVIAGQRFGLIRFGSRLDVYLPEECRIPVQKNQRTRAGLTIIGYLP